MVSHRTAAKWRYGRVLATLITGLALILAHRLNTVAPAKSKLWKVLDAGHYDVQLTPEEKLRIKCWVALNCPLWPDYKHRTDRPSKFAAAR